MPKLADTHESVAGVTIEVPNLKEFRRSLRGAENKVRQNAFKDELQKIADVAAGQARAAALATTGETHHFAASIVGDATSKVARIGLGRGGRKANPANPAFWGARTFTRTGWYAKGRRTPGMKPQHQPWVGDTWQTGSPFGGPYVLNRTVYLNRDLYGEMYLAAIHRVAATTFE